MEMTMTKGFCELNEQEMCETEGGCWWVPLVVVGVVGAVLIYEPMAQTVDSGNRRVAQIDANSSGQPVTIHQISIWNNISGNGTYTAYPEKK